MYFPFSAAQGSCLACCPLLNGVPPLSHPFPCHLSKLSCLTMKPWQGQQKNKNSALIITLRTPWGTWTPLEYPAVTSYFLFHTLCSSCLCYFLIAARDKTQNNSREGFVCKKIRRDLRLNVLRCFYFELFSFPYWRRCWSVLSLQSVDTQSSENELLTVHPFALHKMSRPLQQD